MIKTHSTERIFLYSPPINNNIRIAVKSDRLLGMHDHPHILHFFAPSYRPGQKKDISNDLIIVVIISSILILLFMTSFHKTMAISPSFELQELINKNHHWVQTYGNSDAHLKS